MRNGGSVNILDEPVTESGNPLRPLRTLCQDNGCQRELSLHSIVQQQWQSAGALFRHITVTYGLPQCLNLFISNHVLFKPHLEFQCSSEILHLTNRIIVTGLFEFKRTMQSS